MSQNEPGHVFLARLGKKRLRPGGAKATGWLLDQPEITSASRILEVACNMATTTIELAGTYRCAIDAVDLDETALQLAEAKAVKAGVDQYIHFRKANAVELPFADNTFDIVINEAMLTMLDADQKQKALQEYHRVLKPNGYLLTHDMLLRTQDREKQKEIISRMRMVIRTPVQPQTIDQWTRSFHNAGFRHIDRRCGNMTLMNPAGMIRDEGIRDAFRIIGAALRPENRRRFSAMFTLFRSYRHELGFIAMCAQK